jgi:EAL domain-containing protein (putative c-di-GMP-specific phosphodiesterase class I)
VEALCWQHPELGLRTPAQFLQLINGQPLDITLGEWVIETALSQMSAWQQQGTVMGVSVNISADHLLADGFVAMLTDALARHPDVAPQRLELEILETAAMAQRLPGAGWLPGTGRAACIGRLWHGLLVAGVLPQPVG